MANILLVVFIAVFAAPIDALTREVSNRTQEGELRKRTFDEFRANFLHRKIPEHLFNENSRELLVIDQGGSKNFFSTIFDKQTMSPILSAYVITDEQAFEIGKFTVRTSYWKENTPGLYPRSVYDDLYSGVSDEFDKGHLNPFAINSFREDYAKSTFVYSNAVPQYSQWNRGAWKEYEKAIRHYTQMTCGCRKKGKMYLMTGTSMSNVKRYGQSLQLEEQSQRTPYDIIYSEEEKAHIEVPKALWTAGCCVWKYLDKEYAQSIAVMGNNTPYKGKDETMGITLNNLEKLLGADVNLFPGVPACRQNPFHIRVDYVDRKKSRGRKSSGYRDN